MIWTNWLHQIVSRPTRRATLSRNSERRLSELLEIRCLLSAADGSIEGTVFLDVNKSLTFDDGDTGLEGWTVFIDLNHNEQLDLSEFIAESVASVEIPDEGQGVSTIVVNDLGGAIADINVTFDIDHTYIGDLQAVLISPAGTRIELFSRIGEDTGDFFDTTLDDEAETTVSEAEAPYTGHFQPNELLSLLDGESPNGTWSLEINDVAAGDDGAITRFVLTISLTGDDSEPFAVTDESGFYSISGLPDGTFTVREVVNAGYLLTSPEMQSYEVTVSSEEPIVGADFGNFALPITIRGQAWDDLNGDGQHDANEPGTDGWTITLLDAETLELVAYTDTISIDLNDDGFIDPFTESGLYRFEGWGAGSYIVSEIQQEGWTQTAPESDTSVVGEDPITQGGEFTITAPASGTAESPAPWLPDLFVNMLESSGLRNVFLDGNKLRFGQATPNVGDGPMHLVSGPDNGDGTQTVFQRVHDDQRGFTDREAGQFSFHPEHNHIHFNDFARYSLRAALPDENDDDIPEVGDIVRGGTKTSFCLIDVQEFVTDPPLPNANPDGSGLGCDDEQIISVGWEDIYGAGTPGQEINVAGLEPGDYWLEATVDPDNHFLEKDESNNVGRILIQLKATTRSHVVSLPPGGLSENRDFGNFQHITLTGRVFDDANSNGRLNSNELGRAGVAVFVDTNGDHILNNSVSGDGVADGLAEEPWAITDEDGNFRFSNVSPGFYRVHIVAPDGEIQTTETPSSFTVISGQELAVGLFGVGERPVATTLVTLSDDGNIVVSDITLRGQADRLTIIAEGFDQFLESSGGAIPLAPQIRIHDPDHILMTDIGVQEGLHTIVIPISELIESNLIEINGGLGNDRIFVDLGTSFVAVLVNGGAGNDTLSIAGEEFFLPADHADHGDHAEQLNDHDHTGEERLAAIADRVGFFFQSTLSGGHGNDRILAADLPHSVILFGDEGNDSILGSPADDQLFGGPGNDTLFGGEGADTLLGNEGRDVLKGESGRDHFDWLPGDGSDTIDGGSGFDHLTFQGTLFADSFVLSTAGGSRVKLQQTNRNSVEIELNHNESIELLGEGGDDRVTLNSTAAKLAGVTFDGGDGLDSLFVNGTPRPDIVAIGQTNLPLQLGVNVDGTPSIANVSETTERIIANLFQGNDLFSADTSESTRITVNGHEGNDSLFGSAGRDSLLGGEGDDRLIGQGDNDTLDGGNDNDELFGELPLFDAPTFGIVGDDLLTGGNGNDHLHGGGGSDTLLGDSGDDTLCGDAGDDFLNGDRGNDTLLGGDGKDTLLGGSGNDALLGLAGADRLQGDDGKDTLSGGAGDDQLRGGSGNDLLLGDDGNDTLNGDADRDSLVGGEGVNSFINTLRDEVIAAFQFDIQPLLDLC